MSSNRKTETLLNQLPPPSVDPLASLQEELDKWGPRKDQREEFNFKPVTRLDTLKLIKDLGNSTSAVNDSIDNMILKHGAETLSGPITHMINTSIAEAKFATKWKIGKILPLHKGKGLDFQNPESFRPISLLPTLGKMMERAVQSQILEFMNKTGQMNENIHSYREKHSTTTTMLQLSNAIYEGCNQSKITTLVTIERENKMVYLN